jgi:hypothetical protein
MKCILTAGRMPPWLSWRKQECPYTQKIIAHHPSKDLLTVLRDKDKE